MTRTMLADQARKIDQAARPNPLRITVDIFHATGAVVRSTPLADLPVETLAAIIELTADTLYAGKIILYLDSPEATRNIVAALRDLAGDLEADARTLWPNYSEEEEQ